MQKVLLAAVILMGLAATSVLVNVATPVDAGGPAWDRIYAGP